jgi:peptide/nickel transport system ATP-binding protein
MLSVKDLSIRFTRYGRGLGRTELNPVRRLDLEIGAGEIVAVIGASGSGKSLLAHAVLGVLPDNCRVEGGMTFRGEPLTLARQKALRGREMVLVPQSVGYLNPLKTVGAQVRRAAVKSGASGRDAPGLAAAAFARYGLADMVQRLYPHQVSGGMARRVLTATATVGRAVLIVADEPTTGLDRQAAARSMSFLRALADAGSAVMIITHDLAAVVPVADRVAVFLAGTTVEDAPAAHFNGHPEALRHPYSRDLWQALPEHGFSPGPLVLADQGGDAAAEACPYAPACARADAACAASFPPRQVLGRDFVRCHHA